MKQITFNVPDETEVAHLMIVTRTGGTLSMNAQFFGVYGEGKEYTPDIGEEKALVNAHQHGAKGVDTNGTA